MKKYQKKFGGKEKVRIFAARFGRSGTKTSSLTILRDYNEVSEKKKISRNRDMKVDAISQQHEIHREREVRAHRGCLGFGRRRRTR